MTSASLTHKAPAGAVALTLVTAQSLPAWEKKQSQAVKTWFKANKFTGKAGSFAMIPSSDGALARVVAGVSEHASQWDLAALPARLPEGTYVLDGAKNEAQEAKLSLGWLLGGYRFALHKKHEPIKATLCVSNKVDIKVLTQMAEVIGLTRTLISTPASDLGPAEIAGHVQRLATEHKASFRQIIGDELLKQNFPAIHAVGRASDKAPRLIDLTWGNPKHPKVTLVGKGVSFDTGGLDMKPASAMYLMRKDMGGAAVALGVAALVMARKLPVRLRLLIPAVENAVDGKSFRPSDVIRMRSGTTVEVGNTDAEGRLILADALTEACADKPDLLIDFATLTGAARSALGTEISALFTNDDKIAKELVDAGEKMEDYLWRLPLFAPYARMLDSSFADMTSSPNSPYAGAITAALFLQKFVDEGIAWAHLDFMAWNLSKKAGRPEGGEAMTLRAVMTLLEKRYPTK